VREKLDNVLRQALVSLERDRGWDGLEQLDPELQRTRDPRHGDFASNVALRAAGSLGVKPRDFAAALVDRIDAPALVARVEIAGPGFVNFVLAPAAYWEELKTILTQATAYGAEPADSRSRILVEYVSANPTGPLHVGHGRHAAYGASLANILRFVGHSVDEEYYVNDAGRQMNILALSVWLRYAERHDAAIAFPPNCYQGDYVRDIADELARVHGAALLDSELIAACGATAASDADAEERLDILIATLKEGLGTERFRTVFTAGLDSVLADIQDDLAEFSVSPQRWFSERSLIDGGAVDAALDMLRRHGVLYVEDGATWFRTTSFGDDKDRVIVRENGERTYFASDIAYHLEKAGRGYDQLLNVLGADHHGYVSRVRAALAAGGSERDLLEVQLVQFVVLYRGTTKVQMSTRSGEYVTLRELRHEVGNDAARFFYVSRSNDQHLEFDLELAKSRSNDNPVYYVQYAHARIASMLDRMRELGFEPPSVDAVDFSRLDTPEEASLMRSLSRFPEIVHLAAENRAPQHIVHYVRDVAAEFHSYYNAHKILVDEQNVRDARVAVARATQQIIANSLGLLDVSAPTSM
jgi:arginyl-tRNA synthetase